MSFLTHQALLPQFADAQRVGERVEIAAHSAHGDDDEGNEHDGLDLMGFIALFP